MNIYVLNTLESGIHLVEVLKDQLHISGILGLNPTGVDPKKVSGYTDQEAFCQSNDIPFIQLRSYSLKEDSDKRTLLSLEIDILIVSGWQRLIPNWLIQHATVCIGGHGSPYGITEGRGRSPQNWAFILGCKSFHFSIFKIEAGMDSGEIIDSAQFPLTDMDDISTSYKKVTLLMAQLLIKNIQTNQIFKPCQKQSKEGLYFPQRTAEDGQIDWNRPTTEIYNFVRALTHPYPGAFTNINEYRISIWKVKPFVLHTYPKTIPGQILQIYSDSTCLVSTTDGYLLLEDYQSELALTVGMRLQSASFSEQMKTIITRHTKKHPDLPLHPDILALAKHK